MWYPLAKGSAGGVSPGGPGEIVQVSPSGLKTIVDLGDAAQDK